jgi:magnesium chelatase family protein
MSLAIVYTRAALGIEAPLITVEVHLSNGLPGLTMVGLPETTVKEARDRVRSALINSGYAFPAKKITINLAPADLPKEGGRYDLPIALALLVASEQLNTTRLNQYEFVGELALTGGLRGVPGAIPSAMEAIKAGRRIVVSSDNAAEVGLIGGSDCLVADHLQEVCAFLAGQTSLSPPLAEAPAVDERYEDLLDVIGQQQGKRALEIVAAGGHNLLLIGPPGENHACQPAPGLLPPLSNQEALESAAIQSLVNLHTAKRWRQRPFRAPHHSASLAAMVGGGYRSPVRFPWPIMACCFLMNCRSLSGGYWMRCANPLSQARSTYHARAPKLTIRRAFSLSRR